MPPKNKIKELRNEIDSIDDRIIELLEERSLVSKYIGKIKQNFEKEVLDTEREKEIIDRLAQKTKILNRETLRLIYENIFKVSRKIQS
jgi:chorismate mutase/prephenate dehydratase|tara:strand:- start:737 stop:1000 length:264 start_codon:yes stop_codon:yes gene_type:complete